MRRVLVAAVAVAASAAACGGGGGGVDSPCDLADAAMVQEAFGGNVADGVEGEARNCDFEIAGGLVPSVNVYHFGDASGFEGTRSGFEDNRGGTTDVPGIGDEAFHPNDTGPGELVVSAGGVIFEVQVFALFGELAPGSEDAVAELATAMAADLGG
jgi:hypothetical protein